MDYNNEFRNNNNNQSTKKTLLFLFLLLKGKLPDLDSKIHLTLGVHDGSHCRRLAGGNRSSDSVARYSNSYLLALEPIHLHLHLGIHLYLDGETLLHLQTRSQVSQRISVQILRTRQHRAEARLVVLV